MQVIMISLWPVAWLLLVTCRRIEGFVAPSFTVDYRRNLVGPEASRLPRRHNLLAHGIECIPSNTTAADVQDLRENAEVAVDVKILQRSKEDEPDNEAGRDGLGQEAESSAHSSPNVLSADTSKIYDKIVVSSADNNAPIDWVLSRRLPGNSRRYYRKLIQGGGVAIDRRVVKRFARVKSGSKISVKRGTADGGAGNVPQPTVLEPQRLKGLRILFEDKYFVVLFKPAGMVSQPCDGARSGTVLHGVLDHMIRTRQVANDDPVASQSLLQGIVHRLDKDTSGVMVVAKTLDASSKLSVLFQKQKVVKEYLAICHGDPGRNKVVDAPLYRRSNGKVGAVPPDLAEDFGAKTASTRIQNVATIAGISLCRAEIFTGRMHQVRAHLKWIRCPVIGDKLYGDAEADFRASRRHLYRADARRPLLHARSLEFKHPWTGHMVRYEAPLPDDMWRIAYTILRAAGTPREKNEFRDLQAGVKPSS